MPTQKKLASILRQHGYKLTAQRRAVIGAIAVNRDHLTPAEIHDRVCEEHPSVGLVTVYRTLDILASLGLICEVHSGGNCRSYLMRRPREHHHHLICSSCGTVADFTNCDLSGLQEKLSHETGFEIDSHLLEFSGRCTGCQSATTTETVSFNAGA